MKKISLKNKRVFVAGHNGLVGKALCKRLELENSKILVVDKKNLDLRDNDKTNIWLKSNKPDYIFIAAARVGGILENSSFPADFIYDNLSIVTNLVHLSYKNNVKKILYLGSSCIYPKYAKQPIKENALLTGELEPTNEYYAIAKIAGMKLSKAYSLQYNCNFISTMPTNLYGPGDNFNIKSGHVVPGLINKIYNSVKRKKKDVMIWGTGKPKREFLYVEDLTRIIVKLISKSKRKHFGAFLYSPLMVQIRCLGMVPDHSVLRPISWIRLLHTPAPGHRPSPCGQNSIPCQLLAVMIQ